LSVAREASAPAHVRVALEGIFRTSLAGVRVIEHSRFARLHGRAVATTRRERIYLAGSAQEFFSNPWLMLHEYCHVLHQWRPGTLSVRGYLLECLRHGYWNNRFEIEARAFADLHLPQLHAALSAEQRLAPVEPPGDRHQQHRQ
jgi:Domain of unknown function (DUF4157)